MDRLEKFEEDLHWTKMSIASLCVILKINPGELVKNMVEGKAILKFLNECAEATDRINKLHAPIGKKTE